MTTLEQLDDVARRLIAAGRSTQYVADLTGLPRHHVQILAAATPPTAPRRMRGPDRQPRGPQQPDAQGRVAWFVGRVPAEFLDQLRIEAVRRGVPIRELVVQAVTVLIAESGRREEAS
jgi:hypothetical protein